MFTVQRFVILLLFLSAVQCLNVRDRTEKRKYLRDAQPIWKPRPVGRDVGDPLFLTQLIEAGNIEEARSQSLVGDLGIDGDPSYSGYLTVNPDFNSNLFFWFFPAQTNWESAPVLLWLQGGPGSSSLYGLFWINGPFKIVANMTLVPNQYSWHISHNVIYIDQPVGTGYSFADLEAYVTNQVEVGRDLYAALIQFFTLFPELQKNDFYVTGESYGGKYVPAISYTIHQNNPVADLKINLKGLAIGNGMSDPLNMLRYSEYVYQIGLVDGDIRDKMAAMEQNARDAIANEQWVDAFNIWNDSLAYMTNVAGYYNIYNYLRVAEPAESFVYIDYVQLSEVRTAIHVGNQTFYDGNEVHEHLIVDIMQSVKPWVEILADNYRVMYYSGQLDIVCAYPVTEMFYQTLNFSAAEEYRNAERSIWYVGDELAGYVKSGGNFSEVLVRNAGHMVPVDQPVWGLDLISKFVADQPLARKAVSKVPEGDVFRMF